MAGLRRPGESIPRTDVSPGRRLEVTWRWWCLIGLLALAGAALCLRPVLGAGAGLWLAVNLVPLGAALAFVRRNLPRNRKTPGDPLLSRVGAGNHATIARGVLIAQLPAYLLFPWPSRLPA